MNKKLKLLFLALLIALLPGFGLRCTSSEVRQAMQPITLSYWRVWDGPDAFEKIIADYSILHPYVTIEYRKLRYEEYEQELVDALAEDRGPDIFSVHNTWVRKYQNKIAPLPPAITMAYPVTKGTLKKEIVPELRTSKSITLKEIRDQFVDAVYYDAVIPVRDEASGQTKELIYGLPLSVDTLAMYYNKDLLNNSGIAQPPQYWNREFQLDVKKLTKQDSKGQIIQAGVALGGSRNIERASDILSVLMMQNGTEMIDQYNRVVFDKIPSSLKDNSYNPGLEALRFYTDFANPAKEVYSWNKSLDNSLNLFIRGNLALLFGYGYHLPTIEAQAPKLNFSVAPLPQIEGNQQQINFANYWLETVAKKSRHQNEAWDFIQFATRAENVKSYLDQANKPTALRALIDEQSNNAEIAVFVKQVLTAKSWYRGADANAAELIIADMIDGATTGQEEFKDIISLGARRVQQTISGE